MKIREIITQLEQFAPTDLQLDWDNSGMQVGNEDDEATGALLVLDVTEHAIERAKILGVNLIISHHPLIFSGLRSITGKTPTERVVIEAIRNSITVYSCHTNIDAAHGGVSWAMADRLSLQSVAPLCANGLGCIGRLSKAMKLSEFTQYVKDQFSVPLIKINRNAPAQIETVAVMGGSGMSEMINAISAGADALVTADARYHDFQRAANDIALIDIGHYESEIEVLEIFLKIIRKKYPTFALHSEKISFVDIV